MITFKKFLSEKAMHRTAYTKAISKFGESALIGFEIEVFVEQQSSLHKVSTPEKDTPTEAIQDIQSIDALEHLFKVPSSTKQKIKSTFEAWSAGIEQEYVDSNWETYLDDDEVESSGLKNAEKTARKEALNSFDSSDITFENWVHADYETASALIEHFDLVPKYGWKNAKEVYSAENAEVQEYQPDWTGTAQHFADELSAVLGKNVQLKKKGNSTGVHDSWILVQDTSILDHADKGQADDDYSGVGIEIISPPTPAKEALKELKEVFEFMREHNVITNHSTGLHVNISIPGIKNKLDPLKLVLFMGDEYILKKFDRVTNPFSKAQTVQIIQHMQGTGALPQSGKELEDAAREALAASGKYSSVNLNHLQDAGYLEFRALGGSNYHAQFENIQDTVGRWLSVIDIACTPELDRQEYLKKLHKLLDRTDNVASKIAGGKKFS
jgi:hypothetical protein